MTACFVSLQTAWTHARVAVVMGQTVISRVSVILPVSAIMTVALITSRSVKVRDKKLTPPFKELPRDWRNHSKYLEHEFLFCFLPGDSASCKGRCDEKYDPDNECHCNSKCSDHNNCCEDYTDLCDSKNRLVSPKAFSFQCAAQFVTAVSL